MGIGPLGGGGGGDESKAEEGGSTWDQLQKTSVQGRRDDRVLFMYNWELDVFMSPAMLVNAIRPDVADGKQCHILAFFPLL